MRDFFALTASFAAPRDDGGGQSSSQADPVAALGLGPSDQSEHPGTDEDQALAEALSRGHKGLRFAPCLEAHFQADTFATRRWLMAAMAVVGLLGYLLVARNDALLMPDLPAAWLETWHRLTLWGGSLTLVLAVGLATWFKRAWIMDAATAIFTLALSLSMMWPAVVSQSDTALTHTNTIVGIVLFGCIATRLRFQWALAQSGITVLVYTLAVHGHTPWQVMVARANLNLLTVVTLFALLLNYAFEFTERRNWLLRRLDQRQRARLLEDTQRLQRLSSEDPLTGLPNRRRFNQDLEQAWVSALANHQHLALLILDVDHFKRYNDSRGHLAGDACLKQVTALLASWAESHQGLAARVGGEEFALLLPGRQAAAAAQIAQDMCEAVLAQQWPHGASPLGPWITISVGVAEALPQADLAPLSLFVAADRALYQAKDTGRNRVCLSPGVSRQGTAPHQSGLLLSAPIGMSARQQGMATVQEAQTLMDGGLWRLRFPAEVEEAYLNSRAEERRQHIRWSAIAGLVLFQLYLFGGSDHFPDVPEAMRWQLAVLCATLAGAVIFSSRLHMPPWWREVIYSAGASVLAIASPWMLSHSQASTVWSFLNCLLLIPLFAGAGGRLPFWLALPPALCMLGSLVVYLRPEGVQANLIFMDSLANLANASLYPLAAAYTLDYAERRQWLLSRIAAAQSAHLSEVGAQLRELSMSDPLTGLPNRRQFETRFAPWRDQAVRSGRSLVVAVIDVDHFKRYNDALGHAAGDVCLRDIAQSLARVWPEGEALVARLGGEEFGLLAMADVHRAQRWGDQACAAVRDLDIPHPDAGADRPPLVTVSVGIYCAPPGVGMGLSHYLSRADGALYQAKADGRDRTVLAGEARRVKPLVGSPEPDRALAR